MAYTVDYLFKINDDDYVPLESVAFDNALDALTHIRETLLKKYDVSNLAKAKEVDTAYVLAWITDNYIFDAGIYCDPIEGKFYVDALQVGEAQKGTTIDIHRLIRIFEEEEHDE